MNTIITKLDRIYGNGKLYEGQAIIDLTDVKFTVNLASPIYVDDNEKGDLGFLCLEDDSGSYSPNFPVRVDTLEFKSKATSNSAKKEAILAEFRRQYDKQLEN